MIENRQSLYLSNPLLNDFTPLIEKVSGSEEVEIRYDPRDLAEIRVYHQGEFVCRAVCQDIASQQLSLREIRQARNQRRAELRGELKTADAILDSSTQKPDKPKTPNRKRRLKLYHHD